MTAEPGLIRLPRGDSGEGSGEIPEEILREAFRVLGW